MTSTHLVDDEDVDSDFRAALKRRDFHGARAHCEALAADPSAERWLVTSMLEDLGLSLARERRFDESIAAFERAIELGWGVVPDGRCEIARVLLLAGRHDEADTLWRELRDADPEEVWTLNAGGMAYCEVDRYEEALAWLTPALRLELDRDDAERIVDQLSDARRLSLERLGRDLDELEVEVDAYRLRSAAREDEEMERLRAAERRAGIPVRGFAPTVAWIAPEDHVAARERWPAWTETLVADASFEELAERMERHLRERRSNGDGPMTIVTIDLDDYADWCADHGHNPADRRSRGSYVSELADAGDGRRWPPGRNEPCWCGSERKYKRCCGGLA
jgi:tetratricopeptide (TPR) repeat protein